MYDFCHVFNSLQVIGSWEMMPELEKLLGIDFSLCRKLLIDAGLNSLGKNIIRKTCLSNVHPIQPHFYIIKLGFAGVYLFLLQNIDCGYPLEQPR